jgi:tetratricopeptide (TPR) repeat protein
VAEEHYGHQHPQTAPAAYLLGIALQGREPKRAAGYLRRAADIWTTSHSRPHRELATAYLLLAKLALNEGRLDEAEEFVGRAEAAQAESLPSGHVDKGDPASLLAVIFAVRGEHERALQQARLALSLWEPHFGRESALVQRLHSDAAAMLLALGRVDEAAAELDSLLPLVIGGPEEASVRLRRCEATLRSGRIDDADAELRAIEQRGIGIGAHELSYALLRALTDVRRGDLRPSLTRLRSAYAGTLFTAEQLTTWYRQLEMSAEERALLEID